MTLPDGWLAPDEADELRRLAAGKTVLELGAWKGRSTVVMAEVARYVVSIDRHQGIPEVGDEDSLPDYLDAVRGLPNVAIVVSTFKEFLPLLGVVFDVAYIDGNHDSNSVEEDTLLACQHLYYSSGILIFHDWDFGSVREGVRRAIGLREPDSLVGSVAAFTVDGEGKS
jgi:SAM-dependent methyltransferase